MLYFSDLDRTIIYSDKFIKKDKSKYECIEVLDGKNISYMTPESIDLIKEILKTRNFIPVTTRSVEQFTRIKFTDHGINYKWSIVSNGGIILYNGKPYKKWNEIMKESLKEAEQLENVVKQFENIAPQIPGISKTRTVDGMFFYIVVDLDKFVLSSLDEFKEYLEKKKWKFYKTGRKVYFLPEVLSKENAIRFLMNELEENEFAALGDSEMDRGMVTAGKKGYVIGGSILDRAGIKAKDVYISAQEGFEGTKEILEKILQDTVI